MHIDIVASIPYTYVHIVIGSIVQNADESGAQLGVMFGRSGSLLGSGLHTLRAGIPILSRLTIMWRCITMRALGAVATNEKSSPASFPRCAWSLV